MTAQRFYSLMLDLLAYSWRDIGFSYDGLTEVERSLMTREEFAELVARLVQGRHV